MAGKVLEKKTKENVRSIKDALLQSTGGSYIVSSTFYDQLLRQHSFFRQKKLQCQTVIREKLCKCTYYMLKKGVRKMLMKLTPIHDEQLWRIFAISLEQQQQNSNYNNRSNKKAFLSFFQNCRKCQIYRDGEVKAIKNKNRRKLNRRPDNFQNKNCQSSFMIFFRISFIAPVQKCWCYKITLHFRYTFCISYLILWFTSAVFLRTRKAIEVMKHIERRKINFQ